MNESLVCAGAVLLLRVRISSVLSCKIFVELVACCPRCCAAAGMARLWRELHGSCSRNFSADECTKAPWSSYCYYCERPSSQFFSQAVADHPCIFRYSKRPRLLLGSCSHRVLRLQPWALDLRRYFRVPTRSTRPGSRHTPIRRAVTVV